MRIVNGKLKSIRKGFTLIEMLVVIFVMGIGLVGALSFFNANINNQVEAKNELIAAGLAQEGVDLVRNIRDWNMKQTGISWDNNLSACNGKGIDFTSLVSPHQCPSVTNTNVYIDAYNLRYNQSAGNPTGFKRTILVKPGPDPDSKEITCSVTWDGRETKAIDYLYDTSL
jgi:prepilin-type N-terminal cleavage/methylation domain-containing protein